MNSGRQLSQSEGMDDGKWGKGTCTTTFIEKKDVLIKILANPRFPITITTIFAIAFLCLHQCDTINFSGTTNLHQYK